jgi:hypothetical protein
VPPIDYIGEYQFPHPVGAHREESVCSLWTTVLGEFCLNVNSDRPKDRCVKWSFGIMTDSCITNIYEICKLFSYLTNVISNCGVV